MKFKNALKQYLETFLSQKFNNPFEARIASAKLCKDLFNLKNFDLRGTENLPSKPGVVFIYNHISNNENYTFKDNFQITLDSHFISSIISYNYHGTPGIRVIRHALPSEKIHNDYYNKFDYIRVHSKDYIPKKVSKKELKESKEEFYEKSKLVLSNKENLIVTPEGRSSTTDESPTDFKAGIFRMIIRSGLDPFIVPLVMANFDKNHFETVYRCEIKKPFRLSEIISDFNNRSQLDNFLKSINNKYPKWVDNLIMTKIGYQDEINALVKKKGSCINKKDLIVFLGSSTFRLWENLSSDFKPYNVINFGFGGAYIKDCLDYFNILFSKISPAIIVLYVGGNDLSLGFTAEKINELNNELISKIKVKFPNTYIYSVSIKPSRHRIDQMDKIIRLNQLIQRSLKKDNKTFFIDIFDSFLNPDGSIIDEYFLIDKLHLSQGGYNIWKKEIYNAIQNKILS